MSTWFDVGGIVGGIAGGVGSDLWGKRSPVVFGMAVLAVPSLFLLNGAPVTASVRDLQFGVFQSHSPTSKLRIHFPTSSTEIVLRSQLR